MVQDVAELVDLAPLDERGLAEDRPRGFVQGRRAIEDHEQTPVGAQAPALKIRQQALTYRGVLGGALPQAERVFLAIRGDPEGHHEAVLPDMHAVEEQRHEVEAVQRRGLPRPELRRGLRHESPADAALARAATHDPRWHRLETPRIVTGRHAHQHLLHDAAIQGIGLGHRLEGRQRDFAACGPHAGPLHGDLPAPEDDLARHGARTRGVAVGVMGVPRAAQHRPVLLEQRIEYLESRLHHQLEERGLRVHQDFHEREGSDGGRFNNARRTGCARLLHGGSFAVRRVASVWSPLVYHEQ